MKEKTCIDCNIAKPILDFRLHSKDSIHRRSYCKPCHNKRSLITAHKRYVEKPELWDNKKKRRNARISEQRQDPNNRARYLLADSKKADRKRNHDCNLNLEFVHNLIQNPCFYCGETSLKMTLDRIDNELGHIIGNVNPCCIRCNMIRGAIPYSAWEVIYPSIRIATRNNLFGDWIGAIHNGKGIQNRTEI